MFHQTSVKETIVKMELPAQMVLQIIHVYVLQGSKEHFVKRHQVKQIIISLQSVPITTDFVSPVSSINKTDRHDITEIVLKHNILS
jgi:hypothetical protein